VALFRIGKGFLPIVRVALNPVGTLIAEIVFERASGGLRDRVFVSERRYQIRVIKSREMEYSAWRLRP
jgi:hypothetical protein